MRNSLFLKLMGAFLLVILIGTALIYFLTSRATQDAFTIYTTRSGQVIAQNLAGDLASFYSQDHSWQGVETVLDSILSSSSMSDFMSNSSSTGQGRGSGRGNQSGNAGMMMGVENRLILADEKGLVINDTSNELSGEQLSKSQMESGAEIIVDGETVGILIVTPQDLTNTLTPASEFLRDVNQAIFSSAVIAAIIALIIGAILFIQLTSPLRKLQKASSAIASGDYSQRVTIKSHDEMGQLGRAFNLMTENLENAMNQRRMMVADVAHELRTPLTAIQGTLEGIKDGVLPMDEEQINALYSETILLNRLVGDLKLLSLADAGQLTLDIQAVDAEMLIKEVVERAKPLVDLKQVHLQTDIQPDLRTVPMDPDRITQVITNLIGNALRYTPSQGTITVAAQNNPSTNYLEISVSDTGIGISPEELPFIFDRFYRIDKSRSRTSGGSGLGLAIVKNLVELHGGEVYAESPISMDGNEKKYGTRITFTIPGQE